MLVIARNFVTLSKVFDVESTLFFNTNTLNNFQIKKPNKYKIVHLDIPIINYTNPSTKEVQRNQIFCSDILDLLTQDFFARKGGELNVENEHAGGGEEQITVKNNAILLYFFH